MHPLFYQHHARLIESEKRNILMEVSMKLDPDERKKTLNAAVTLAALKNVTIIRDGALNFATIFTSAFSVALLVQERSEGASCLSRFTPIMLN